VTNELIGRPSVTVVAELLRRTREDAVLTQVQLAERAGVASSTVSAYESGRQAPSLGALDRLFAALGRQLWIDAEPIAADVDAKIDAALALPLPARLDRYASSLPFLIERLAGVPYVIEGAAAAFLQGAPVPVPAMEIVMLEPDLGALCAALERIRARRWSRRWRQWGFEVIDPRHDGEPRWKTIDGELRLRVAAELPAAVGLPVGEHRVNVRPLLEIEAGDPAIQRILVRLRQRLGSAA
jgi:transcriptional regulator with XRE-family HTH domain